MGYESRLEELIEEGGPGSSGFQEVLDRMRESQIEDPSISVEEDNDFDLFNDNNVWEEDPNESPIGEGFDFKEEDLLQEFLLTREAAEKARQIVSAILEETISQSKLEASRVSQTNNLLYQAASPMRDQPSNRYSIKGRADKRLESIEMVAERNFAFAARPKIEY